MLQEAIEGDAMLRQGLIRRLVGLVEQGAGKESRGWVCRGDACW